MSNRTVQQIPKLKNLPPAISNERAVRLELEQGILIFRSSKEIQKRIENLIEKSKTDSLTENESKELETYAEIDDYLSHVNRLIRNSFENSGINLAA